jgi:hypothetical protein
MVLADRFLIPELQNSLVVIIRGLTLTPERSSELEGLIIVAYQSKAQTALKKVVADRLTVVALGNLRSFFDHIREASTPGIVAEIATEVAVSFCAAEQRQETQKVGT